MTYTITTEKTWPRTQTELGIEFDRWGISEWNTNYPKGSRSSGHDQSKDDRTVMLKYKKDGREITLVMGDQDRAVDNLRVLYLAINSIRLNEKRGINKIVESAYLQLSAPDQKRNPYEVLGITADADLDVAEAVYRTKIKSAHPDKGGSDKRFKELQEAIEELRKSL